MSPSLKTEKDDLRRIYKEKRRAIPDAEKLRRDSDICRYAASLASFRYARYVLLYDALPDEISLTALAQEALKRGKIIAYPLCDTENCTMTFRTVSSPDELSVSSYGIREPSPDAPLFSLSQSGDAVCFVPGLVFDKSGYRLGYGKGYYDRFISSFAGNVIGVIYSDFIVPSVPRGRYDTAVGVLLTENNTVNIRVKNEN